MSKNRMTALLLTLAMAFTLVFSVSAVPVNAAKKIESPSKVIVYYNDYEGSNPTIDNAIWKKSDTTAFKYNSKGYVTAQGKVKTKWTIKSKKPTKAVTGTVKQRAKSVYNYKKGKLKTATYRMYNKSGKVVLKATETYTYKKSWITKISGDKGGTKYTDSYTYTFYSNGSPKRAIEKFRAYGETYKTVFYFNKKGLLTKIKMDDFEQTFKYKYDDQGRVIEKVEYFDGDPMGKTIYKYDGSTARNKKTYMAVVNYYDYFAGLKDVLPSQYMGLAK